MSEESRSNAEPPLVTRVEPPPEPSWIIRLFRTIAPLLEAIAWCLAFLGTMVLTLLVGTGTVFFVYALQSDDPKTFLDHQLDWLRKDDESGEPNKPRGVPEEMERALAYGSLAAQFGSVAIILLVLPWRLGRDWRKKILMQRPAVLHVLLILLATPGFMLLTGGIEELLKQTVGISIPNTTKGLVSMYGTVPWFVTFLAVGLGPGLTEEIWCRGFIGRKLTTHYGLFLGVAMTSILFGLLHCSLTYAIPTALMGAYLHFVYLTSRSIWISILLHTLNNSIGIALSGAADDMHANPDPHMGIIYLVSFSLVLFASIALWTSRARLVAAPAGETIEQFPGTVAEPPGGDALYRYGKASPVALVFTLISFVTLLVLVFH